MEKTFTSHPARMERNAILRERRQNLASRISREKLMKKLCMIICRLKNWMMKQMGVPGKLQLKEEASGSQT